MSFGDPDDHYPAAPGTLVPVTLTSYIRPNHVSLRRIGQGKALSKARAPGR